MKMIIALLILAATITATIEEDSTDIYFPVVFHSPISPVE